MADTVAFVLIGIGLFFTTLAVIGLFRFKTFYLRILVGSNSDTVGMLFMLIGAMVFSDNVFVTLKIFLILILAMITTPLASHATARSAYVSGVREKR